jgi:hypothetical protein
LLTQDPNLDAPDLNLFKILFGAPAFLAALIASITSFLAFVATAFDIILIHAIFFTKQFKGLPH